MDSSSNQSPKLALFSFPSKGKERQQSLPVHAVASVPFKWEEAPGKPRSGCTKSKPCSTAARSLELPPRLVFTDHHQAKVLNNNNNNGLSPTTVLKGPFVSRALSSTLSFRKGGSFRSPAEKVLFGSSRWVGSTRPSGSPSKNEKVVGDTFDFFTSTDNIDRGSRGGGGTKVEITRVRKRSDSSRSLSGSSAHLWTSIYESFKRVVTWKRSSSSRE